MTPPDTAARLAWLCARLGATYTRTIDPQRETVRMALALPFGDVIGGEGPSTLDALVALDAKCRQYGLIGPDEQPGETPDA